MSEGYLPQNQRQKSAVSFVITDRDVDICRVLNRYRFLRSGQIKRLVFPNTTTMQSTRRRLKYLYHHGYVGRIEPFIQVGKGSAETAYFLDKAGRTLLLELEEPLGNHSNNSSIKHPFLDHALDISEFRIHLEMATAESEIVALHRFVADHEIKKSTQKAIGRKRYRLFDSIIHPVNRKNYTVYPDALIVLRGKGRYESFQRLYFLEIDRGTEGLSVLRDKLIGYNLYYQEAIFKKYGAFSDFRVLIQTTSAKRQQNILDTFVDQAGASMVWITHQSLVSESSILHAPIWLNYQGDNMTLLKPKEEDPN